MLKAKLVVVGGDAKAKEVDLKLPTVIGRGREASLTLPHPLVSRRHTEIFEKDGYLYVKDLGSLNGTYVNNRRIEAEQRLAPNQLLTLGNVTFRAMYDAVENSDATERRAEHDKLESDTKESSGEKEETVNFERVDEAHNSEEQNDEVVAVKNADVEAGKVEAVKKRVRKPLKTGVKATVKAVASVPVLADSDPSSAIDVGESANAEGSSSVGDLETPSDIFSGEEEFITPEKSISLSSLDSLPSVSPVVSVLGDALDLGDQPQRPAVESIDLDIGGQSAAENAGVSDPELGSFLKKLPR